MCWSCLPTDPLYLKRNVTSKRFYYLPHIVDAYTFWCDKSVNQCIQLFLNNCVRFLNNPPFIFPRECLCRSKFLLYYYIIFEWWFNIIKSFHPETVQIWIVEIYLENKERLTDWPTALPHLCDSNHTHLLWPYFE